LLQGFYDIASFGKLLSWAPWLLALAVSLDHKKLGTKPLIFFVVINGIFLAFALRTSQRGPVMAGIFALAVAVLHHSRNQKNYRFVFQAGLICLLLVGLVTMILPRALLETRIIPLFSSNWSSETLHQDQSRTSISQRTLIWSYGIDSVKKYPLGKPCIDAASYDRLGIPQISHSHNEFLEQARTRGWIFGLFNLVFWIFAWINYARRRDLVATAHLGGLSSVAALSLVDHPWFVLNHSLIIGVFLLAGFIQVGERRLSSST
ncbi:MAG: O-antigen ligase domain-containing protein, partial [Proteobacteria bacterium]